MRCIELYQHAMYKLTTSLIFYKYVLFWAQDLLFPICDIISVTITFLLLPALRALKLYYTCASDPLAVSDVANYNERVRKRSL